MELVSEPAVLTRVAPAGPRGRVLVFVTRGHGAVRVFARRQPRRPGHLVFHEPIQAGELSYRLPSAAEGGRLVSFVPQRVWPGIRERFDRTVEALAFLEAIGHIATEGDPQPELFRLLVALLDRIEHEDRPGLARVLASARLLRISGFAPRLGSCIGCGKPPAPPGSAAAVDVAGGGAVCRGCLPGRADRSGLPVLSAAALAFLIRAFGTGSVAQLWRLRPSREVAAEGRAMLERFVEASVGSRLLAHDFLAKIRRGLGGDKGRAGRDRRTSRDA